MREKIKKGGSITGKKRHVGRIVAWLLCVALAAGLCAAGWVGWQGYDMYRQALAQTSLDTTVGRIRAQEGYTRLYELPKMYTDAVIAVEDHRFYRHGGFDALATVRALYNDLRTLSFVEGGSTITQQLGKNLYFTQEKKLTRKVAEVFMAFAFEKAYTKDELLELYVNSIYFGGGYTGIGAACRGYLGKEPKDMTDAECVLMAGIPNAPSAYAPTESTRLARERQLQVLARMVDCGYLTQDEADAIEAEEVAALNGEEPPFV
ncbi:MAG: biosynthetic peptidoglycan transglycosylase [Oscillospiraceae bacterium]|nr:biosynthetic peptidoglycan transglycosylase [Oscillospiraceae bacterium]